MNKLLEAHGGASAVANAVALSQIVEREEVPAAPVEDAKKGKKKPAKRPSVASAGSAEAVAEE